MPTTATVEQLAHVREILAQLDRQPETDQANRRQKPRLNIRIPLTTTVLGTTSRPTLQVFSRNISTAGIGFVSRRLFKAGEFLTLQFQIPDHPPKLVLTHVTFCRYVKAGLYEVGAEFIESITVDHTLHDPIPPHWLHMADPRTAQPQPTPPSTPTPAKTEPQAEPKPEAKPEAKSRPGAPAKAETKSKPEVPAKDQAKAQAETKEQPPAKAAVPATK